MLGLIFVVATVLQTISSQGPHPFPPGLPEKCKGPPKNADPPHECCKIPPFFSEDDFKDCGFTKPDPENGPPRPGPPDCSKQQCILQKHGLLKNKDEIDREKAKEHLDKWLESNPEFEESINDAKLKCLGTERLPGPPHICEANKIVFCITHTLFNKCPNWEQTDGCKNLKEHMDFCSPYFHPPEQPKE